MSVRRSCEHAFVSTAATILHADLDAFYASVEQRDDPSLRGKPVVVGGGVVLAASYEARAHGIRSAMGGRERERRCPDAIVVPGRWPAYVEASKAVFAIFARSAITVERISIDEAFLDVSGLDRISGSPAEIAARLRREVREEVGLPISVGVASSKAVAKVASNEAKPDGLLVVPAGGEPAFLGPLAVEALWGVGPVTGRKLRAAGIATVGRLAVLEETALMELVGRAAGRHLHAVANGRDPRPVRAGRRRRSFGAQSALGSRARSPAELDAKLLALVDRVTRRMRSSGRVGRTVTLRLRFGDFTRATRSRTLPRATAATEPILATLRALLEEARPLLERRGLTLIGVTVGGVEGDGGAGQLVLDLDGPGAALDAVLDSVRDRYGSGAVQRAALLGAHEDATPWLLSGDVEEGVEAEG
jgi:DNA polymerase-4